MKNLYTSVVRLCKSAATYRFVAKVCSPLCVAAFLAAGALGYKSLETADAADETMLHRAIAAGAAGVVFLVVGILAENRGEG